MVRLKFEDEKLYTIAELRSGIYLHTKFIFWNTSYRLNLNPSLTQPAILELQ
jgi:hypothetical protein